MNATLANNFRVFSEDFVKDTGYEFNKENMGLYLQYAQVRWLDILFQNFSLGKTEVLSVLTNSYFRPTGGR